MGNEELEAARALIEFARDFAERVYGHERAEHAEEIQEAAAILANYLDR